MKAESFETQLKRCTHSIVARCSCGGWVMQVADMPFALDRDVKKDIAAYVIRGFAVQRLTLAEARNVPCCKEDGRCITDETQEDQPDPTQITMTF